MTATIFHLTLVTDPDYASEFEYWLETNVIGQENVLAGAIAVEPDAPYDPYHMEIADMEELMDITAEAHENRPDGFPL